VPSFAKEAKLGQPQFDDGDKAGPSPARVMESKDPCIAYGGRSAEGRSYDADEASRGELPEAASGTREVVGVLRLRECFASRTTHFAQDDKFMRFSADPPRASSQRPCFP
jgi:hypothetical protein